MTLTRRSFLKSSAALGMSAFAAPAILGADKVKRYRTALIGTGWWGMNILEEAVKSGQSQVVALCDVDPSQREVAIDELGGMTSDQPRSYSDFREMFDQEQIDIAIIATPDHWHSLQSIAALKHGAHVFVEKPTGHTINESRAIVSAAKAADRIVQVGLHRRIGPHHVSGMQFLRKKEHLGNVAMVKMFVNGGGGRENPTRNTDPPEGMNWDMYCGPAPLRPYCRRIHPGGFREFLDFANGQLGDWGVHWLDQVLWWADGQTPRKIFSTGGREVAGAPILNENEQTTDAPDHQVAVYEFESFTATWEHRKFGGPGGQPHPFGCYFYGENGVFHMGWRDGWTFYPRDGKKPVVHQDPQFDNPQDGHNVTMLWRDFLNSIETKQSPAASIEIGHRATTMSLLGMLSMKLGRSVVWDGEKERFVDDAAADKLLSREYRGEWVYPQIV